VQEPLAERGNSARLSVAEVVNRNAVGLNGFVGLLCLGNGLRAGDCKQAKAKRFEPLAEGWCECPSGQVC
jgi:hypothetical protein